MPKLIELVAFGWSEPCRAYLEAHTMVEGLMARSMLHVLAHDLADDCKYLEVHLEDGDEHKHVQRLQVPTTLKDIGQRGAEGRDEFNKLVATRPFPMRFLVRCLKEEKDHARDHGAG